MRLELALYYYNLRYSDNILFVPVRRDIDAGLPSVSEETTLWSYQTYFTIMTMQTRHDCFLDSGSSSASPAFQAESTIVDPDNGNSTRNETSLSITSTEDDSSLRR